MSSVHLRRRFSLALLLTALLPLCPLLVPCATAAPPPPPASQAVTGDAVLQYLDQVIDWYRQVIALDQSPLNSQELLLRESVRQNAKQVVRLSFDFARAQATLLDAQSSKAAPSTAAAAAATNSTSARLAQATTRAVGHAQELQDQVDQLNRQLESARGNDRDMLTARRDHLVAQLNLVTAQRDTLQSYSHFMRSATAGPGNVDAENLLQKIADLEQSVPDVQEQASATTQPTDTTATTATAAAAVGAAASASSTFHPESAGVFSLISEIFTLSSRMNELNAMANRADKLRQTVDGFRGPVRAELMDALHRGDALSTTSTTQPATDDPTKLAKLDAERQELENLTGRFKQLASAGVPLGEQSVLLESARANLLSLHALLAQQHARALRSLLVRLGGMVLTIVVLIVISEVWRRATFRYVTDARRRRQLMMVRRIVIAVLVLMIIIASVVTEFGSLATFAGLITAGIAVALQTVILSGVAYFFFIGRFGVRVGDRVTINGITGDVVEIGLFRIYLMELAGSKTDPHPTGRIVVFSNSVLFQPQAFYKQLPGADYVWHELSFTLSPDTEYGVAEHRLMDSVESVYAGYKEEIQRQYESVTSSMQVAIEPPRPQSRLRFVDSGLEFVVRYPVDMRRAAEIDDQITRKLLESIDQEPKLKLVASTTPKIQAA
jgi:small-conductance mechanosensitive channel